MPQIPVFLAWRSSIILSRVFVSSMTFYRVAGWWDTYWMCSLLLWSVQSLGGRMASTIYYSRGGMVGSYDYDPLLWWYSFMDSYILTLGSYFIRVYGGYGYILIFFYYLKSLISYLRSKISNPQIYNFFKLNLILSFIQLKWPK